MHRRCASRHAVPLHTPTGVLHKALPDETLFHNMKHLLRKYEAQASEAACIIMNFLLQLPKFGKKTWTLQEKSEKFSSPQN